MSIVTPWGYTLAGDVVTIPAMLTEAEFNAYTADKYAGDARVASEINAASNLIRNYIGWHLFPAMSCAATIPVLRMNGRVKYNAGEFLVQLPATHVPEVSSILVGSTESTDFISEQNGLVHIFDPGCFDRRTIITVNYTAGLGPEFMDSVKELIVNRIIHGLERNYGIQSQTAGGVSISYANSWNNDASTLSDNDRDLLIPFKVQGVY